MTSDELLQLAEHVIKREVKIKSEGGTYDPAALACARAILVMFEDFERPKSALDHLLEHITP